ncbi:N-acetylmuramic acid 6-phosphate etherase [Roseobacter fucihabitans]|uniref:N-acetylmuramic acid 6-phosphate etherase n=1 Tax=Roseobacter fucihabitans TaxID=1537242 RepID=A0ABZ2BRT9_9RHOB|nr:N-acetylmuramic acid 6-phosphate etherase [Roseobacter litoralis]MBC6965362.1 N-acetylmuramic acid 6-phosphate etherase [Roseobacter litoralis]MBC6965472.1 N-acetylmuramic acid 6-phosphate etherase [Roseobacter litoralis]
MSTPATEHRSQGISIDAMSLPDAVSAFTTGQCAAIAAVDLAASDVISGAEAMARAQRCGGSLVYVAAGSSGLMALADASELPGTFGVPQASVKIHMAGGVPVTGHMPGDTEDDHTAAPEITRNLGPKDVVIVLSASGSTPYAVAVAQMARAKGCCVVAIANNRDTVLLAAADVAICLATPAEIIAGSTRLGAGTAQKVALNLMSTLMGVMLGHVYDGMMVNVVADNKKLRARAVGMVCHIVDVSTAQAESALERADGRVKLAVLLAAGCALAEAERLLRDHDGHLGPCLQLLRPKTK